MSWPNDFDGELLRRLDDRKFDFNKKCAIDFTIDFNNWPLSSEQIEAIQKLYPNCEIISPTEDEIENGLLNGYVQFQVIEKLSYNLVVKTQEDATKLTKPFGGYCESWGVSLE